MRKTANLSCDVPCEVLPALNWELNLSALKDTIIFIDEEHPVKYHSFERIYDDFEEFIENERYVTEDEAAGL